MPLATESMCPIFVIKFSGVLDLQVVKVPVFPLTLLVIVTTVLRYLGFLFTFGIFRGTILGFSESESGGTASNTLMLMLMNDAEWPVGWSVSSEQRASHFTCCRRFWIHRHQRWSDRSRDCVGNQHLESASQTLSEQSHRGQPLCIYTVSSKRTPTYKLMTVNSFSSKNQMNFTVNVGQRCSNWMSVECHQTSDTLLHACVKQKGGYFRHKLWLFNSLMRK